MSDPTYDAYESSIEEGRPIEMYRFTLNSVTWRYTSCDHDVLVGAESFGSLPIENDGIKQNGEAQSESMTIICPDSVGPAILYSTSPPDDSIMVELLRMHEGMTSYIVAFVGFIQQIGYPDPGQASLSVQSLSATMKRAGLRLGYQRPCPHSLYDQMPGTCMVPKSSRAIPAFLGVITGDTVTCVEASSYDDHWFANGFMEWTHPVRGLMRVMIEDSLKADGVLTIFDDVQELNYGMPVTLYPGCDKTPGSCQVKFTNYDNYGGFEYMPGKSPYDGNPIY